MFSRSSLSSDFDRRPVTGLSRMFDVSPRGFGEVSKHNTLLSTTFPTSHSPHATGFLMPPPNLPVLRKFPSIDASPSDLNDQLFKALYEEEYAQCLPNLEGDDIVWLVDYLDKVRSCGLPSSHSPLKPA